MANGVRINNLNQATSLNDTDTMTIIQDNENKKASISLLDKDGTYTQSVVNTIPDLITTSKANVETTKQSIDEKFGYDEFSAQIVTSQVMSSVGVSDDGSVDVSSQVQDGFMESAILKGQTLVNVLSISNVSIKNGAACFYNYNITPQVGEKYLIKIKINSIGMTTNTRPVKIQPCGTAGDGYFNITKEEYCVGNEITKIFAIVDGENITNGTFAVWCRDLSSGEFNADIIMIKYQDGMENWDIPYFEGMQSVKMPTLHTVGKNLFDGELEAGSLSEKTGTNETSSSRKRSVNFIRVSPNTSYKFSINGVVNAGRLFLYDQNKTFIRSVLAREFSSTQSNEHYMKFRIEQADMAQGENIQIEEGSTATSYENHKSSILSCNEDVALRKVGNVRDELNLLTGEVTERIGEMMLNGGEEWGILTNFSNGDCKAYSLFVDGLTSNIVCDGLKILPDSLKHGTEEGVFLNNNLLIVKKNIATRELFKQWLAQNPITVQYQLATESVKAIDLNSSNGDVKTPVIYKNGHILLQSDGLIPELHYSIPVSYSGLIAQNTMTNLKHSWRLDELEIMAYTSIVNSQYESLILVATAETNEVVVSSEYAQDESLYNMLKVLVNANALVNADEKINVFYLYGKLSDEMYIDLIMGDDM